MRRKFLKVAVRPEDYARLSIRADRDGLKLAAIGAAIGMLGAFPLPRLFEAAFYDFHVLGGWLFVIVPAMIGAVALLGCYVPAHRAARVDPIVALRYE